MDENEIIDDEMQARIETFGPVLAGATVEVLPNTTVRVTFDDGLPGKDKIIVETDEAKAAAFIADNVSADFLGKVTNVHFLDGK